jgi:hypothetical protein
MMLVERMVRAARLDVTLYNEVEHDEATTAEALYVVVLAAVASGLGTLLGSFGEGRGLVGLASEVLTMLLNWVIWSYVTYFVGTRLFDGTATPAEMLRTLGFAMAPGVLNVLGFIPCVGGLVRVVVLGWMLAAGVVAVREALDFDTGKAIGTVVVGWVAMVVIYIVQFLVWGMLGWTFRML